MSKAEYEWDAETVALDGGDDPDILDHNFSDRLCELPALGPNQRLVLVRDEGDDRQWAYVDMATGRLPEEFRDAYDRPTGCRVLRGHHEAVSREWPRLSGKAGA